MNSICSESLCTGCCSCFNKCSRQAISMAENDLGVIVPKIDESLCSDCGLCRNVCPQLAESKFSEPKAIYAAWAKNKEEHLSSSSGGAASVFYRNIIEKWNGAVVGAAFGTDLFLCHQATESVEDINKFKGSKYVQSFIGDVFSQIKEYIKDKKPALFIGTPCQVDGLKSFLGNDSEYLFTADLICHGVPPVAYLQKHFEKYVSFRKGNQFVVSFRKGNQYNISFNDKRNIKKRNDIYLYAFLKGLIYRESCYNCKYAQKKRVGDITLGDFWGLSSEISSMEDAKNGCSVILVNTAKGEELFNQCKNDFVFFERALEEACKGNGQLNHPVVPPESRKIFLQNYKKGFSFAVKKASFPEFQKHCLRSYYYSVRRLGGRCLRFMKKKILAFPIISVLLCLHFLKS